MDWDNLLRFFEEKGIALLSAVVYAFSFIASPFVGLIYPPLEDFAPAPVTPPALVEKSYSIEGYKILYDEASVPAEKTAAETLAAALTRITGLDYAASTDAPSGSKEILVGRAAGLDVSALGMDGYIIKAGGDSIFIAGGEPRGTIYGAYQFLQKYFGCRWYADDLIVIPPGPAALAPVEDERYVPPFEYREMDWLSCGDPVFSVANGLNGTRCRTLPAQLGGTYGYNGHSGHTMVVQFLRPAEFFAEHPEWYAYREDSKTRVPNQLCLTNPETLAEMVRQVRGHLDRGNGQPIVSVKHADNLDFCQCPGCKAVDAEEGSHAGTMIRFVNAVAQEIAQTHPWAYIETFAYQYSRTPPGKTRPLPNVMVQLCSIECCFAHPLDDPDCPDNARFAEDIKGWSEICEKIYIWDYTTNFMHFNCVYPNLQVLQKNMRFFAKHGVRGVYEEGNYTRQADSEFQRLRAWLLSRLLYNPDVDCEAETDEFLKAYYGGGWQYVREFLRMMAENTGKPDWLGRHRLMGFYMTPTDKGLLDLKPNQIRYADRLWEKAADLAGDEACEKNVRNSQIGWRYWKACNRAAEFSWLNPASQWRLENERLYGDLKALGITYRSEGILFAPDPGWYGTPIDWRD